MAARKQTKKIQDRKGGELKAQLPRDTRSAEERLINAVKEGDVDLLKKILKSPVDVNFQDDEKNMECERTYGVELRGTNWRNVQPPAGRRGKSGNTALMLACQLKQTEAVEVLLAAGADPAVANLIGETALHLVGEQDGLVDRLVAAGAPVDALNAWGTTPLMFALIQDGDEYLRTAGKLLEYGADPSLKTIKGEDAFAIAADIGLDPVFIAQMKDIADKRKKTGGASTGMPGYSSGAPVSAAPSAGAETPVERLRRLSPLKNRSLKDMNDGHT